MPHPKPAASIPETEEGDNDARLTENWSDAFEPAFYKDSAGADCLAHLLYSIRETVQSGSAGVSQALDVLSVGIRTIYPYTEEYKLSLRLYQLYLTGHLKPENEPRQLLEGAIERGMIQIKRAIALEQKRKKRGTKKRR